jgi:cell wall-associated NlpC family hydrolase
MQAMGSRPAQETGTQVRRSVFSVYCGPMCFKLFLRANLIACALSVQCAFADESQVTRSPTQAESIDSAVPPDRDSAQTVMDRALDLIGVRYRRGGDNPKTGFDCSGFVDHVFREVRGMILPHSSRAISKTGLSVAKDELKAGDLVFFHNLRNAVSHIGIYIGDHRFVHAPRPGEAVGVADLRERYWAKRYFGARRIEGD